MPNEKRKKKQTESRDQPLTLEALQEFGAFKGFNPPTDGFDPNGTWRNTYSIWVVGPGTSGYLQLERAPAALKVTCAVAQSAGTVQRTEVEVEHDGGALSAPRSWRIESWLDGLQGKPVPLSRVAEQATLGNGNLEITAGDRKVTRKVPTPITSNWSLFDVVQRLSGAQTEPLSFALLEDLDLAKPDQRLSFRESRSWETNGGTFNLQGYQLIGRGILPYVYWVDDRNRLLVAISGQKAFIFDADAVKHLAEIPKGRRARQEVRE